MYKEPFLLPMENLPVGLGDTRRLSASNGLKESRGPRHWLPQEAVRACLASQNNSAGGRRPGSLPP